jgi:hypothetical protein
MKIRDILPVHVREWVTQLSAAGVSPAQIRHLKIILSAVFTTALNDFVVVLHPCRGVKTPTVSFANIESSHRTNSMRCSPRSRCLPRNCSSRFWSARVCAGAS